MADNIPQKIKDEIVLVEKKLKEKQMELNKVNIALPVAKKEYSILQDMNKKIASKKKELQQLEDNIEAKTTESDKLNKSLTKINADTVVASAKLDKVTKAQKQRVQDASDAIADEKLKVKQGLGEVSYREEQVEYWKKKLEAIKKSLAKINPRAVSRITIDKI